MALLKGLHRDPVWSILVAMPRSLARILVHTIFSTRDRRPSLRDTALRKELHHYLGSILKCGIDCREGGQTIQPFQGRMYPRIRLPR